MFLWGVCRDISASATDSIRRVGLPIMGCGSNLHPRRDCRAGLHPISLSVRPRYGIRSTCDGSVSEYVTLREDGTVAAHGDDNVIAVLRGKTRVPFEDL